jgi:hypothetical protein
MYTILNKNSSVPTAQRKWNTVFDINSNEWKQIYILPFKATACRKLHWFQFRINHNILATNYFLKKIKIIDDANCNFCQKENETIEHIFWGCENVQKTIIFSSDICLYIYSILCLVKCHCRHHLYILYQHPQKLESSLKMFGLCLCHRTKNLLALEDFVHFHNKILYIYKQMSEEKIIVSFA